jgi:hypothetical protein
MMKKLTAPLICALGILLVVLCSGCVAPPEEKPVKPVDLYDPNQFPQGTPTGPGYVTEATPFETRVPQTQGYHTLLPTTAIPEDQVCVIWFSGSLNMTFEANKTAKSFDLKNPPLYINFTITKPFNVTGERTTSSKYTENRPETTKYSYYSPYSYLEITVRDRTTGTIYTQDGFGKTYGTALNKTIQVMKPGDLLIEIAGNNVTPAIGIWAKPFGNLNDPINLSTMECNTQDYVKRLNRYI